MTPSAVDEQRQRNEAGRVLKEHCGARTQARERDRIRTPPDPRKRESGDRERPGGVVLEERRRERAGERSDAEDRGCRRTGSRNETLAESPNDEHGDEEEKSRRENADQPQ